MVGAGVGAGVEVRLGEVVEEGVVGDGERGGGRKDHEMRDSAIARRTVGGRRGVGGGEWEVSGRGEEGSGGRVGEYEKEGRRDELWFPARLRSGRPALAVTEAYTSHNEKQSQR